MQFGGFDSEFASGSLTKNLCIDDVKKVIARAAKATQRADDLNPAFDLALYSLNACLLYTSPSPRDTERS
eukprot:1601749-Karenia_brevis.AAC.1